MRRDLRRPRIDGEVHGFGGGRDPVAQGVQDEVHGVPKEVFQESEQVHQGVLGKEGGGVVQ